MVKVVSVALGILFKVLVITLLILILNAYLISNELREDILYQQKIFNLRINTFQNTKPKIDYKYNLRLAIKMAKTMEGNIGG